MIHGNEIPSIPDGALRDLSSLQVFKFSYNKLRVITGQTLQGLSNLMRLHIDHNKIEFIHPQAFNGLMSLRLLHLEGNLLHQLHPSTFSTFTFLDYFRISTIRHLYLAENMISTLPTSMLQNMPLLENLYLQGNPWTCDCHMRWFLEWDAKSRGILKCKKDKAYEGGQLCAMCSSPKKLYKHEIHKLKDMTCLKPSIESPLRQNRSMSTEEEQEHEEDGGGQLALEKFQLPQWSISLNMTDEHGNMVSLVCDIKKPMNVYKIHLNQTDPPGIDINATVALDFECPMTRENYEKLWKLIAYYSEVPVKLHRELMLSKDPSVSYQYRQDADEEALYYTGVRAQATAEPEWVLQPSIDIQLNRRQSTAKKVLLSYYTQYSQTISTTDTRQARGRSWVMIEPSGALQRAQIVLEGDPCQLSCNVKASESPSIFWVLPDGSILKAPMDDPDSKFSILSSGWLRIKSMEPSDSGMYQCIAQVRDEMDRMAYRVFVQSPSTQSADGDTVTIGKNPGETVMLPCNALAIPEAHFSWILPNRRIINDLANTSHVYMLPNGTLSIPKVQVSDSGYYRCVAVNQQGADHFMVGITVTKKGSGSSSKKGRRPGAKALSRVREDIVEDEGGSGMGDEENTSRKLLHPKDQEVFLKTKDGDRKAKKGRRKLKLWKHSEKEPETNVAEGRRGFESRRRINMANKQINPERWADILAKVRGKNLPKGTEVPQVIKTTTPPSLNLEVTPSLAAVSPPSASPVQTATSAEESSADVPLLGEEEHILSTISSASMGLEHNHNGVILVEHKVPSTPLEEVFDEFSEKTEEITSTKGDLKWIAAPTLISESYEPSPTLYTLGTVYEGTTHEETATEGWFTADVGSVPEPTSSEYEPPLDTVSLAESERVQYFDPDLETDSQPDEDKMKEDTFAYLTPTPTMWVADSSTLQSFEDSTVGEPGVPGQLHLQGPTDNIQLVKSSLNTQDIFLIKKGVKEKSQTLQRGDMLEGDPTHSRSSDSEGKESKSNTLPHSTLGITSSMSPVKKPAETTVGTQLDKDTTTATTSRQKVAQSSTMTTHPSRRRPNGRRRLRPHKFRHRNKQTPPTTFAPSENFSTQPTQAPEIKSSNQVESSLVPTSWVDNTVNTPKQLEMEKNAEPISKGTSRKKHGKRPNKHQHTPSTVSSRASASKPSSSPPENKRRNIVTPSSETMLLPRTVSLKAEDPYDSLDYMTTTTKIYSSYHKVQETLPITYKPTSDGKEIKDDVSTNVNKYKSDTSVPGGSVTNVLPTSHSLVSTVGEFKEESSSVGFPGTPTRTAQPRRLHTDIPVTTFGEKLTDHPLLKELEEVDFTSEFSSSVTLSTPFQQEEAGSSTTLASIKVEVSSSQAETTTRGQEHHETTVAVLQSETRPQNHIPTPAWMKEPASPPPPMIFVSLGQTTTTKSALLGPRTSQTSRYSKENVFFNYVGNPETKAAPVNNEGTQHMSGPNELSTPSSNQDAFNLPTKQELEKQEFDSKILPPSPDIHHQDGRVHTSHQPARIPAKPFLPRGTVRPPETSTESTFKYFVTFQSPRHWTNKPEVATYPSRALPESKQFTNPRLSSTTTPLPSHMSKPSISSNFADRRTEQLNGYSKVFGNTIPEARNPVGKPPSPRIPHYPNGRFLSLPTRLFLFHITRERKVNPGFYNRIHSHSTFHLDFGPPAPPLLHAPAVHGRHPQLTYRISPWSQFCLLHNIFCPVLRKLPPECLKVLWGGPPASKFWSLGEKPQILTNSPQTVSATAEADAVFPCEATGKPKPFITWTKVSTGALMTPNTRIQRFEVLNNGTLVIRKVQVQDRGQYMCTASNLHGLDRMVVLLSVTVQQPQILASHYQDVTVYLGDTIAMECLAKGTPAPQISWIFPDRRVWQTVSPVEGRITLHENRTLSIKEASFSDRGVYKCVASNAAGADSLAIRLHVAALPPVIHQEKLENISLPPGLSIHIHCTAKAAPLPSVRWVLADGTQIRPSQFLHGNLFVFPNGTLYIRNLAPKDSGRYECVAANMVGSARRTVQLNVQRAAANARITGTSPRRTDVTYGGTLKLDCSASGDPWPRILWRLPSKRMIDALFSRIKAFANGTLVVRSVTDKDAGDYLCVARIRLVTTMWYSRESPQSLLRGDLKVDCVATGLPNPDISWSLPDGSLVNSFMQSDDSGGRTKRHVVFNNGTLYFNEVGMREEGDYTCFAENQVGKDEMRVRVKVVTAPAAISNRDLLGGPGALWRRVSDIPRRHSPYSESPAFDSGNYTCLVRNSAGEDRKTVWIHANVQPPKINGNLNPITTVQGDSSRGSRKLIDCRAEGIPTPRVLWAFPEGGFCPLPYKGNRSLSMATAPGHQESEEERLCPGDMHGRTRRGGQREDHGHGGPHHQPQLLGLGTPTPSLVWVLPMTDLQSGQQLRRFYHKADGMPHISSLSSVDAGLPLVARNAAGHTERLVSLKVGLKPEANKRYHNLWRASESPQALGRVSLLDNGTLTVREASVFDRGTYAGDRLTALLVTSIPVIVIAYPPRITSESTPVIYTRPGSTVKLNCMAMGIPKADITWELPDKSHLKAGCRLVCMETDFFTPRDH
ncbi:LOW QUALITY PROTEIN: Matrix-remodeling-associated protein 5 [Plecturocebus cupreus]